MLPHVVLQKFTSANCGNCFFFKYSFYQTTQRYSLEDFFFSRICPNLRFSSRPWSYIISFLHLWPLDGKSYVNIGGRQDEGKMQYKVMLKKIDELMLRDIVVSISKYVPVVYFL